MRSRQIKVIFFIFSLVVTIGILFYLFKYISVGQVVDIIKNVDRRALLMFIWLSLSMSFFRTWRYGILLELSGFKPSRTALFLVVLVRNFFSDLLPARIGTTVYVFITNTRLGIPLASATSSFALSFLFDILAMVPLLLLASLAALFTLKSYALPLFVGGLIIGGITFFLIFYLPYICNQIVVFLGQKRERIHHFQTRMVEFFSSISAEILKAKQAGLYAPVMVLSLLVRLTKYASLYVFLYALLHGIGYRWEDLPIPAVFLGISASEFAASLPISGIASFGAYEGTWAVVFELLGFSSEVSKLTAISHHLFTQVYGYLLGIASLLVLMLPFFKKKEQLVVKSMLRKPISILYRKMLAFSIGLAIVLYGLSKVPSVNSEDVSNQKRGDQPSAIDDRRRDALMIEFPGRVLFDSNRSGTFGIYTITVDGSQLKKIIDEPGWHEMFPDPSPDGKRIVFARSKSLNRLAPSEVVMVSSDGTHKRKLVGNATFPTFGSNGERVYFERSRKKVMVLDLKTGNVSELFPSSNLKFRKYQVVKPRIFGDQKMIAFTSDTPRRWHAWYADLQQKEVVQVGKGCEPVFFNQGKNIAFISDVGVKERSGILSFDMSGRSFLPLEDAAMPRGHEYFPTLAFDDRYLLFSAAGPKEHSHETANYQIFVKDLISGIKTRITFDAHTNRWPKLLRRQAVSIK